MRSISVGNAWQFAIGWTAYDLIIPPFLRSMNLGWLISDRTLEQRLLGDIEIAFFLLCITAFCAIPSQDGKS